MEPKKLTIKTVLNGWRVKVGCQEVVFDDKDKMLAELSAYLDNPAEVEKKYKGAVNYKHFNYDESARVTFSSSSPFVRFVVDTPAAQQRHAGDGVQPAASPETISSPSVVPVADDLPRA